MAGRKRRVADSELHDTAIVQWDEDGQYSTVKANKIISGVCKVGELVVVRMPPPGNQEYGGVVTFVGTASDAEVRIGEIVGKEDLNGIIIYLTNITFLLAIKPNELHVENYFKPIFIVHAVFLKMRMQEKR